MILNDQPPRELSLSRQPLRRGRTVRLLQNFLTLAETGVSGDATGTSRPGGRGRSIPAGRPRVWCAATTNEPKFTAPRCARQGLSWPVPPLRRCHHSLILVHQLLSIFASLHKGRVYLPLSSHSPPTHQLSGSRDCQMSSSRRCR